MNPGDMNHLLTAPAFSPDMTSLFRSWGWVRSDFAEEFKRLSDAGALRPGGVSETIWSTRTKFVLKVFASQGFDLAYKSFFKVKNSYKYFLRRSPCASEAVNYTRLTEMGFPLPDLLAAGEIRCGGALKNAFMATRFLDGYRNGVDFYNGIGIHVDNIPLLKEFCRGHLALLARLHDRGFVHGGFTPANLLYRQDPDGMKFAWIDVAECAETPLSVTVIADDLIRLFRYLKISADVRRELESDYLAAATVRRVDAEELFRVLENRIRNRMKKIV